MLKHLRVLSDSAVHVLCCLITFKWRTPYAPYWPPRLKIGRSCDWPSVR